MNKIYKVIWSKVRNCYVAVSEIAKRNGKSCTSVNCGAKANRGHAGAVLSAAVGATLLAGVCSVLLPVRVALAADVNTNTTINSDTTSSVTYYELVKDGGVTFTVGSSGNVNYIISSKSGNTITIQSGGRVSGATNLNSVGWSLSIIAGINNNNLNSAGTISQHIAGGLNNSTTDSVVNNHVAISGGKVSGDVFGGFSNSGNAGENNKGNTVNISGGQVTGNVYGGYSKSGGKDASYNQVSVSDANASPSAKASINFAYGGYSKTGHASYNQVSVSGENASVGQVYGGYAVGSDSNYSSTATKNIVTISGGEVRSFVHGGYSESGDAGAAPVSNTKYGNTVTISGGTVNGEVYGGRVTGGTGRALYNEVIISGTGEVNNSVYGGNSRSGVAQGNRVEISGGKVTGSYSVYGGTSWNSNSLNNSVVISGAGSMVGGNVYGGQVINGNGTAKDNNVSISGSATIGASGSTKRIVGGYAKNGATTGNTVDINLVTNDNGTPDDTTDDTGVIWGTVYGGYSESGDAGGVDIVNGNTVTKQGNTVTITGGTVNGNVFGGYVSNVTESTGSAINNAVNISGTATIGASNSSSKIYGGYTGGTGNATGNTVNINLSSDGRNTKYGNTVNISGGTVGPVYGGYVYSGSGNASFNNVIVDGTNSRTGNLYGGYVNTSSDGGEASYNTVTVNAGCGGVNFIYGGASNSGAATNNSVVFNGGIFNFWHQEINGGSSTKIAYGNNITFSGGSFALNGATGGNSGIFIRGGRSNNNDGEASYNTIAICGGSFNAWKMQIYGGDSTTVSGNTITLAGGSFTNNTNDTSFIISGGHSIGADTSKITNNTINLYGTVTGLEKAILYGGDCTNSTSWSGENNELHIGGTRIYTKQSDNSYAPSVEAKTPFIGNTISGTDTIQTNAVKSVNNFNSIVLHKVNWSPGTTGTPVLAAESFSNIGNLDISGMSFTGTTQEINAYRGRMPLLQSDNNNFSTLSLKYSGGTETLSSTNKVVVKDNYNSDPEALYIEPQGNNVTFRYRPNVHTVYLDSASSNKYKVMYSITDNVKYIGFESGMSWSTTANLVAGSKYDFSNIVSVDASSLSFNFTNVQAGELSKNSTMTLVSNATGLPSTVSVTYKNSASNHTQSSIPYNITNVASLSGTLTGKVERAYNDVLKKPFLRYSASSMTLDTVNLGSTDYKWDGSTTTGTVPAGWTANPNGISVTTAGLTVPTDIEAGTSRDILTTNGTANYFQSVQFDSGSTNNNVYKLHSFSNESSSGSDVTFTGTQYKGVKVGSTSTTISNDKLVYAVDKKNVTGITLGGMSWGTERTPGSDDYNFSTVTGVDASGLTFTFTDTQAGELQAGSNMTLLSGATGLPVGVEPSYGGEKTSHSQSVPYSAANSVTLTGTLTGTVATKAEAGVDKVTYTALGMTLNSINLAGWNSSTEAPFVPAGWTNQLGNNSITADGFTGPTLAAGESRVILQATTEGYFNDNQITGGKKNATTGLTEDTAKGVTFAGNHLSGGVKADANGTKLAYYAEAKDVSGIKLGNVAWNDGRPAETLYVFNNVTTVDATDLLITFANESDKGSLSNTSTTTLVSNATGLPDSVAVNYKNSASNHTQEISYNITNGVSMTGTLTGTIASGTVSEKKALVYSVSGMTLDSINLAGWDSSIAATAVPAGWTNQLGNNSITAEGFDEPALALGQSLDILTATTEGYFNDDQITGGKKYSTSSLADDTVNGVTLSGTHYGGVKAEDNGKKLTYYAETMDVTGIALGNMTWGTTTGRTASGLYIFNNVSSVNASGLSFTNPDEVSGSMELLSGATDLAANKMVTGADHSQSFDKAMTNGVSLSSTLKGTVSTTAAVVKYTATGTTVNSVNLAGWDGTAASSVPDGWALAAGATIETDGMSLPMVEAGEHIDILKSSTDNFFANVPINGDNAYGKTQYTFMESDTAKSVTDA